MDKRLRKEIMKKNKYEENPEPKREYEKKRKFLKQKGEDEKNKCDKNPVTKKSKRKTTTTTTKIAKRRVKEKKICLNKVENFCQQEQDPYFICTVCHRCLYKRNAR